MLMKGTIQSTVYDEFGQMARLFPNRIAVSGPNGRHSFADTFAQSERIRCHLQNRGVRPGDLVAVLLERDVTLPAALMAVFGAGASYLPLEKGDPTARQIRGLELCGCRTVLGSRAALAPLIEAMREAKMLPLPDMIEIENILPTVAHIPAPLPPRGDDIAYVLMTSGSTGEPKAVDVTHANVMTLLTSARERLAFSEEDRYLATSPLTFDASVPELFLPLTTGATIVLEERDLVLDPQSFTDTLTRFGVTIAQTTPSTWTTLLATVERLPKLRVLITHGEAISPDFARTLAAKANVVLNMYGPTETTVWATAHQLTRDMPDGVSKGSAPIGAVLPHFFTKIVDSAGRDLGPGQAGELCLGGGSVTRGYRNDPERTAKVFFDADGVRFYRTGDLVQQDGDGTLHYLGRIDDQMAINGLRIEPGEIETALLSDTRIAHAVVTWYPVSEDQRAIVAAVVPVEGHCLAPAEIRSALADRLGRSMLPARYLVMPSLPSLSSGKVDRKAIRAAALAQGSDAVLSPPAIAPAPAMTATEERLAEIWCRLLELPSVQRDDEFFLIGGDSLAAVELMAAVDKELGQTASVEEIFEHPSLAAFAAQLDALAASEDTAPTEETATFLKMKSADSGVPLYFVLADYGYTGRAGKDVPCPIYNLTIWNRSDGILKMRSLEEMAARYRAEIQAHQPEGPYRLAGYSVGGMLVYELARQLIDAGQEVASLFLLDPTPPTKLRMAEGRPIIDGTGDVALTRDLPLRNALSQIKRIAMRTPGDLQNLSFWFKYKQVDRALKQNSAEISRRISPATRNYAMRYATGRMAARYIARPLDIPATLVASDPLILSTWTKLLRGDVAVHIYETGHRMMFRDPYEKLWTQLLIDQLSKDSSNQRRSCPRSASECAGDDLALNVGSTGIDYAADGIA